MTLQTGQLLAHYRIEEKIGEGGMGVLYRAVDTRLNRPVAIKLLRFESRATTEQKQRFVREAQAASALNHPGIVTIHEIGTAEVDGDEVDFIAMEYVDGRPLHLIDEVGKGMDDCLRHATQMASALAAAHEAGIVHRDIKPANIMVTGTGQLKVLDFGLAKRLAGSGESEAPTLPQEPATLEGTVLGTVDYMSPEQAAGRPADARSDVFSIGVVLHEMLTGERPFSGDSPAATLAAVLNHVPDPVRRRRPDVPADLERIIQRCLEKQPQDRYASASALLTDLEQCRVRLLAHSGSTTSMGRPAILAAAFLVLSVLAVISGWRWLSAAQARRVRAALPEIRQLVKEERYQAALRLLAQAREFLPDDPEVERLRAIVSAPFSLTTTPPGAAAYVRDYDDAEEPWIHLGHTPLSGIEVPGGYLRWRLVTDDGGETERAFSAAIWKQMNIEMAPEGEDNDSMVQVPGGTYGVFNLDKVALNDYLIDRFEVTNAEFQEFVDAGGYEQPDLWQEPFNDGGRSLSWEEAMDRFRDSTGRPGPATWELGAYPEGESDHPVRGVSWYEAVAYARFSGKSLPSIYHWYRAAAGSALFSEILLLSNFDGKGPAAAGEYQGLSPFGSYDMAGNVKEWCWNQSGKRRYILGGAWDEVPYVFSDSDARPPFDRSPRNGFRCMRSAAPPSEAALAPVEGVHRDYDVEEPVSDEIYQVYRNLFAYDATDLEPTVESTERTADWAKERVTFNAAYGDERVPAYLYLPQDVTPPYQVVVVFPAGAAFFLTSSQDLDLRLYDFMVRSGRAVAYPIYKGTYERRTEQAGPNTQRDLWVQFSKDLGRTLDYLETRDDIDMSRIAFYGVSAGAIRGPTLLATEERITVAILVAGGLPEYDLPAEIDPLNFAPRVKVPVLMINGRNDFEQPLEKAQLPLFRLLGAPEAHKRHAIFNTGHVPPWQGMVRESLDWLDRYLGPVDYAAGQTSSTSERLE